MCICACVRLCVGPSADNPNVIAAVAVRRSLGTYVRARSHARSLVNGLT